MPLACSGFHDQGIEQVLDTVMGRDDAHLAAPHGQGVGGLEDGGQVFVKRPFIDHHVALHPPQVAGVRAERLDLEAAGEVDDVDQDVFVFVLQHLFADLAGGKVVGLGPHRGGLDKLTGHIFGGADIEGVATAGGSRHGAIERSIGRFCPGQTGSPRLLGDLDFGLVSYPALLIGQQHLIGIELAADNGGR